MKKLLADFKTLEQKPNEKDNKEQKIMQDLKSEK